MRVFYEEWEPVLNRQPLAGDLVLDEKLLLSVIRQPLADEFNWSDFFSIGFSHHIEIISKKNDRNFIFPVVFHKIHPALRVFSPC